MKKVLISVLIGLMTTHAFADAAAINQLIGLGMAPELAVQVDKQYGTAFSQSIVPGTDNTYDLGTAAKRWRTLYLGTSQVVGVSGTPVATATPFAISSGSNYNAIQINGGVSNSTGAGASLTVDGTTKDGNAVLQTSTASGATLQLGAFGSGAAQGQLKNANGTVWQWNQSGDFQNDGTNGGNLIFNKAGTFVRGVPQVAVPLSTPVAGTNACLAGLCVIPTFAANAAVFLGPATPVPGDQFVIANQGANTERVKAAGGATINGAVAGGYIGLATNTSMRCWTATAGTQICDSYSGGAIPTPAGP